MEIREVKKQIENKTLGHDMLIFRCDDDFVARQYAHAMAEMWNYNIVPVELDTLLTLGNDIFGGDREDGQLLIYSTDKLEVKLPKLEDVVVICKKIDKKVEMDVIEVPKLEKWQLKDYAVSRVEGLNETDIDKLIEKCQGNIHRLDLELNKITLFDKEEREALYKVFESEGALADLTTYTIFDISNCILKKDRATLAKIYEEIDYMDVTPAISLCIILLNNLRNIIKIQLSPNPTAESCGLDPKRFWAIKKYNCGWYSREQLYKAFDFLTDLDRQLKNGELLFSDRELLDYIITHMLSL